jgi:hypothetical protein
MNKNLYQVFGLLDPKVHRTNVKQRMLEMYSSGEFTKEEYEDCRRNRRRQGKTTNLAIQAIDAFLKNKKVIVRVMNRSFKEDFERRIRAWMPIMLSHKNFYLTVGTISGNELIARDYDVLLDDDKEYWR